MVLLISELVPKSDILEQLYFRVKTSNFCAKYVKKVFGET
jgi:hypothetical protein